MLAVCNCDFIDYVNSVEYSGMHFEKDLSPTHVLGMGRKLRSVPCLLYNTIALFPLSVTRLIAHSLALNWCAELCHNIFFNFSLLRHANVNSIFSVCLKSVACNWPPLNSGSTWVGNGFPKFSVSLRRLSAFLTYRAAFLININRFRVNTDLTLGSQPQ